MFYNVKTARNSSVLHVTTSDIQGHRPSDLQSRRPPRAYNRVLKQNFNGDVREFAIPRKEPKFLRKMEMGWDSGLIGLLQSKFQVLVIMSLCS